MFRSYLWVVVAAAREVEVVVVVIIIKNMMMKVEIHKIFPAFLKAVFYHHIGIDIIDDNLALADLLQR